MATSPRTIAASVPRPVGDPGVPVPREGRREAEPSPPRRRVIVIDSDRRAASQRAAWLCDLGWHATAAGSVDEARRRLARGRLDVIVAAGGPAAAGAEGVRSALGTRHAAAALVAILPVGDDPGGWDAVVPAPPTDGALAATLDAVVAVPTDRSGPRVSVPRTMLGDSPATRGVLDVVRRVADTGVTVLVPGESGTGKSLLAREIHRTSRRRHGPFVEVACGSLSETLLESELFGHVAGAYTGAAGAREGRFAQADGGTIFLDEIATATPALQVKLLRVLQEMAFEPVGGGTTRTVDARLVLATHEDLAARVAAGTFRADLYWRINVVTIEIPALRDRRADIPQLAHHFLERAAERAGRPVRGFTDAALRALLEHDWPGNVRELEHAVERAVFLGSGASIDVADLPPGLSAGRARTPPGASLREALEVPERRMILDALERNAWRRDAAARALGINRTTLYKKAKRLGLDLSAVPGAR